MEFKVVNVNQALSEALYWMYTCGIEEDSRNGPVLVAPEPVMITYTKPYERVLFSPLRDANPFFHLMESLWMLAGRNDVEFPAYFAKNISNYSDDSLTLHGAYGHRWRKVMTYDQLALIAKELQRNPESRRCVLQMWDASGRAGFEDMEDLRKAITGGKDVPCNTQAYFDCRGGKLNMIVTNRSNDAIWGAFGANAVHFSVLQEYMAAWIGVPMGVYRQFTNNLHVYTKNLNKQAMRELAADSTMRDYYLNGHVKVFPIVNTDIATWDADLNLFFDKPLRDIEDFVDVFFRYVASPMYRAWHDRKTQGLNGLEPVGRILAEDWRLACQQWISRRAVKVAKSA